MEHDMKEQLKNSGIISGKIALRIFKDEYLRWILNSKWLVLVILLVLMRELIICPMLAAAGDIDQIINLIEPAVAVGNSGVILLLLPLFYLLLTSDFPRVGSNLYYLLPRAGRINWVLGELLFSLVSAATYLLALIVASCAQVFRDAYFINGWSIVTTHYDYMRKGQDAVVSMNSLIPGQLYNQMPPFQALARTYALLLLSLWFWGSLLLFASLYAKKKLTLWIEVALIAAGTAFAALRSPLVWLFPSGHTIVWLHYQNYYRQYVFPIWGSILFFLGGLIMMHILIYRRAGAVSLDVLWEEKTE